MIVDGRIHCINPRCRRTASAEKNPDCNEIVCGKCWRSIPLAIRERHSRLQRRERRLLRRVERRCVQGTIDPALIEKVGKTMTLQINNSWHRIRNYFLTPEVPIGLEGFLMEVGL